MKNEKNSIDSRTFLKFGHCYALALTLATPLVNAETHTRKNTPPNVILILADDMGVGDIAINKGGLNNTPNLDKLTRESVCFEQGYSASAVSAPARASLLTGRYPHRTGVVGLDMKNQPRRTSLGKEEITLANIFADNGYQTGIIGKWHLGNRPEYHSLKRGFNECAVFVAPFDINSYFRFKLDINGTSKVYDGPYLTEVLTDSAISFVNRHRERPFFLHLAHYAPHRPLSAPQDLVETYLAKGFDQRTAQVYAMIEVMDTGIGKLLNELDRLGIRENTIVVFASDNGPDPVVGKRFNRELKGNKYMVYEGGIRVPLIFNWKGTLSQYTYENIFHFVDIFPTLMEFCKIDPPASLQQRLDGKSIAEDLLEGRQNFTEHLCYWQWNRGKPYYTHNAAVRKGDWKLVFPHVTSNDVNAESELLPVLYNLKDDPKETTDVSSYHPKVYDELKELWKEWSKRVEGDRLKAIASDR